MRGFGDKARGAMENPHLHCRGQFPWHGVLRTRSDEPARHFGDLRFGILARHAAAARKGIQTFVIDTGRKGSNVGS